MNTLRVLIACEFSDRYRAAKELGCDHPETQRLWRVEDAAWARAIPTKGA